MERSGSGKQLESPEDSGAVLSLAEYEVLDLAAHGLRNRAIAQRLWKSEKTVEKQIHAIFEKFGLDPREPELDRRVVAVLIFLGHLPFQ